MSRQARILARDAIETSMSPEGGARKAVDGCEAQADSIANGVLGGLMYGNGVGNGNGNRIGQGKSGVVTTKHHLCSSWWSDGVLSTVHRL